MLLDEQDGLLPSFSGPPSAKETSGVSGRQSYLNGQVGGGAPTNVPKIEETVSRGTGRFISSQASYDEADTFSGEDGVTLNLVDVPIATAAKTILGDILKLNFTVSDKVGGKVTIQTTTPIARSVLTDAFEAVLRANDAMLVESNGFYKVLPAAGNPGSLRRGRASASGSPGTYVQFVTLRHVAASEMKRLIEPVIRQGSILRADTARNLLVLSGTNRELQDAQAMIDLFDVDWLRGMSFALYPVKASDPEAIAKELDTIFGLDADGPLKGVVRFVPNRRLGSILVMSSQPDQLDKARVWVEKLDRAAQNTEQQLFVYKIQNRSASELAELLQRVLSEDGEADTSRRSSASGDVAPRYERVSQGAGLQSQQSSDAALNGVTSSGASDNPSGQDQSAAFSDTASPSASQAAQGASYRAGGVKVVADEANNSLLIQAVPKKYERILRILERLDVMPTQVLLEAVIAEVTLNDELRFGLKWYFEKGANRFTLTNALSGAVASSFPGFSYFFSTSNIQVALDALSSVTNVNVVSAPSLMVMDNRKATLQVGDQVPIITQTAQSVTNPDAPVVNAVTLKDTGVILAVTPHVNDSGRVVLDIEQEVSNVSRTTTSGIDSPTIQQRRVKTTVAVRDNEVIALGGLIQQRDNVTKSQVPLLGNLPVVGSAFRTKSDRIDRTELIIFMRPKVVRDVHEARQVTEEFRQRINLKRPASTRDDGRYHIERDLGRVFR